jgi:predicted metal-dependent RNase
MDHSGYIPALYELGYKGKIYCTKPTAPITKLLWRDHLKIEGELHYSKNSFLKASNSFKTYNYDEKIKILDGVYVKFIDAGHILGSASVLIEVDGALIYYSGDINDQVTPFHLPAKTPDEPVDILLVEATNGNRSIPKRRKVTKKFVQEIKDSLKVGRKIIIPSFALGRGQEIQMYLIKQMGVNLYTHPLYVDGMINKMNAIYDRFLHPSWISEYALDNIADLSLDSPFDFEGIRKVSKETVSMNINEYRRKIIQSKKASVILTTSGMLEGGPILSYLADQNSRGNLLAIVGYQVDGTIGRDILNGEKIFSLETPWGQPQEIKVHNNKIERFFYSGHASQEGLLDFIIKSSPKIAFSIHSNFKGHTELKEKVSEYNIELNRFDIDRPYKF